MALEPIDVHEAEANAEAGDVWRALVDVLPRAFGGRSTALFAWLLGCEEREVDGAFPAPGASLVGFRVVEGDPGARIVLEGRHRFARYRLAFNLEPAGGRGTVLSARSWAVFPGVSGQLYKAAVIGTRAHVLVTRRLLRAVILRAEAGRPPRGGA